MSSFWQGGWHIAGNLQAVLSQLKYAFWCCNQVIFLILLLLWVLIVRSFYELHFYWLNQLDELEIDNEFNFLRMVHAFMDDSVEAMHGLSAERVELGELLEKGHKLAEEFEQVPVYQLRQNLQSVIHNLILKYRVVL